MTKYLCFQYSISPEPTLIVDEIHVNQLTETIIMAFSAKDRVF